MLPKEKELKKFAKTERSHHVRQAIAEGVVALLPAIAVTVGAVIIKSQPAAQERLAPAETGLMPYLFTLVMVGYMVFLYFVVKDIRRKLAEL